jgi:hypothetical protein
VKIFISWSGARSHKVAEMLHDWIPEVLQNVVTWMSAEDIDPGARWVGEIAGQLAVSDFGILCITPENQQKPWLLFEGGALTTHLKQGEVCPYVLANGAMEIAGPLAQFQSAAADHDGTLNLLRLITRTSPAPLSEERLRRQFERCWPQMESLIAEAIGCQDPPDDRLPLGVQNVYLTRADGLADFNRHIEEELHRGEQTRRGRLWIVGSSLLGLLDAAAQHFDAGAVLKRAVELGLDVRILMTHPQFAWMREEAEKRAKGTIVHEIRSAIAKLRSCCVPDGVIRLYPGAPTAFAMATSSHMIINPYPYEASAHHCFSLVVRSTQTLPSGRTGKMPDIYGQYLAAHFADPWNRAVLLDAVDWEDSSATPRLPIGASKPAVHAG